MKIIKPYRFRTWLILLLFSTSLFTFIVVGSLILLVKIPQIRNAHDAALIQGVSNLTERSETILTFLESDLYIVGNMLAHVPENDIHHAVIDPEKSRFNAIYLVRPNGKLTITYIRNASAQRWQELVGMDMSQNSLFRAAASSDNAVWSDRYLSVVSGHTTEAVAMRLPETGDIIIGELSIRRQILLDQSFVGNNEIIFTIVDSNGEIIADSEANDISQIFLPKITSLIQNDRDSSDLQQITIDDIDYDIVSKYSQTLGWHFTARVTTGLDNPEVISLIDIVLFCFGGSLLIGLLIVPFWARTMVSPLNGLVEHASRTARGTRLPARKKGAVQEFNRLLADLDRLATAVRIRQQELGRLNDGLEKRVRERTAELERSNAELSTTLEALSLTQDELVQAEKMAALGRLVAGIAHELNTPLGNGRMAVSTLSDQNTEFSRQLEQGIRKSDLHDYLAQSQNLTTMIERNIIRASDLVSSFKQVAVDRTSSLRRKFSLADVIHEIVLTLTPSLKNRPITIEKHIDTDFTLDSFPGEIGQIITNLIDNALIHAFDSNQQGIISVHLAAAPDRKDAVLLEVRDNGRGMTEDVVDRIFDPFFTTRMGSGGTGLGLSITANAVNSLLGGTISATSTPGEGTTFRVIVPLIAPEHVSA
ncbi:ATP-binding protein [Thalassospira sp. TSL5-1]|uniref:sensor histidine kinase n=1 Tax=Thalassospira sp. TSL5-1 TaxID=1544451 RepID=UPI00093D9F1E|nr:ATP-binding protein [Thalassospira sp. TSL5-1]